jgi:NAD(P)-dependent dehydrogenase (short-subunit alcohol dehydrogenase family)
MHWLGRVDFDSFTGKKRYNAVLAYGQSKLCNILFTQELARWLQGTRVIVNAAHPGGVDTGIARDLPPVLQKLYSLTTISAGKGAQTPVYLATSPELAGVSGHFFSSRKARRVSPLARPATAARLWAVSEDLCGP